uniref:Glycosyltransferase n=1 Tax=Streptococcus suis TaxID=1307 RepID=A0A1C9IGA4_STRSU|nr:Glycosyltransferase [Streptococcus suis]
MIMNIGLLIYDLRSGGAERVLCKWSDLLSEENSITIYMIDGQTAPEYSYSGKLSVLDLPSRGKNRVKQIQTLVKRYLRLRKQIKQDNIDLLISFCSTANFPAMFQRIPRIASIRLYSEYFSYQKIYRFLIKHTQTALAVQTDRLKNDILLDVGDKYASKIHVIGNSLDTELIKEKMKEEPEEKFLEKIKGKRVICFTASFKTSKNHWNLIKSFNLLHTEMPETVLVLIGGQGELEEKIHRMVDASPIKDSVIFIGKTTNPFKYEKYADIFVLPSITEGIPNVLLEAMAVGLPVISADCPSGPREILIENPDMNVTTEGIEHAEYGLLVEPFPNILDFDINNITKQNTVLYNAMKVLLSDKKLNDYYRYQAIYRTQKYDMAAYKKKLYCLIKKVERH